jgi:hypothetical protein
MHGTVLLSLQAAAPHDKQSCCAGICGVLMLLLGFTTSKQRQSVTTLCTLTVIPHVATGGADIQEDGRGGQPLPRAGRHA